MSFFCVFSAVIVPAVHHLCSMHQILYPPHPVLSLSSNDLHFQDTNWARKREHTEAGNMLHKLEGEWLELVGKNYAVERACAELETEVEKLEALKKQKLSEQSEVPASAS